jgi:F-type H+-transporting ATPase subunit b
MADVSAAAPAAEHASGGLPQFDASWWPSEIVWALAIFGLLYLLIALVFVPRIGGTIAKREDRIAGDVGDAKRARDAAQAEMDVAAGEMAAARARAQKIAHDAQTEAKAAAVLRQAQEENKIAQTLASADARIAAARAEAMSHVRAIAVDTAQAMIERLTGQTPAAGEVDSALRRL